MACAAEEVDPDEEEDDDTASAVTDTHTFLPRKSLSYTLRVSEQRHNRTTAGLTF